MKAIDPRMPRFEHTVLALAVTSGFVFEAPYVIPVWGLLMLLSGLLPTKAPVPRLYRALLAPRAATAVVSPEETAPWRAAAFLSAGLLGLGTLPMAFGHLGLAWLCALAAAGISAVTGVGGVCVGCRLHRRRGGR